MSYELGVDVGGTFTDLVRVAEDGSIHVNKISSTENQAEAIVAGIESLDLTAEAISFLAHGTTVATNALITKTGARTALVTTRGFRDVLELRRTNKGDLYDLQWDPPPPIVGRANRLEITERIGHDGQVIAPLAEDELPRLIRILRKREIESVAIVFLHSYVNDAHERLLAERLRSELPQIHVSISSEVLPLYREFERTATVAANAFVAPVMQRYFGRLRSELDARGFDHDVLVMQSNGGLSSLAAATETPAKLVRSGPSAGAVAVQRLSRSLELPNVIGLDIGGTSADVALVVEGRPKLAGHLDVEFGLPIMFPSLDIVSIGAGGGSIAHIDPGGSLKVGPASAGSIPGPACYGQGGVEPTSTDAQVVLGRLAANGLVGGDMAIDPSLSERAVAERIASPLDMDVVDAAEGIASILTDSMMRAVRFVTIEKGYDPRDFALCGFGGAGPMYAADIARELSIPTIVVPRYPGVFSAWGLLHSDVVYDAGKTLLLDVDELDEATSEELFADLEAKVLGRFEADRVAREDVRLRRQFDVLYTGQIHALSIQVPAGPFDAAARAALLERFHAEHRRVYGHAEAEDPVTMLTARVFGERSRTARPAAAVDPVVDGDGHGERDVFFAGAGWTRTPVIRREGLAVGQQLSGPAIVTQRDTTTVLPPATEGRVAETGDLIVEVRA